MKREGPCCHCGIAYTPLWRSGPPEKPVLCNACGSRWRIRGTLADYVPKHATQGRKAINGTEPYFSSVCIEDETTNKSSSGSTASSETCFHTENITGLDEIKIWDRESIPRRKRSVLSQWILSPMERLHKDLLQQMYQEQIFTQAAEEDELIYENTNLFSSPLETVYGAILLQSPNTETMKNNKDSLGTEKESKHSSGHKCTSPKNLQDESANGEKDVYIHPLPPFEVRAVPPTESNRDCQLQYNRILEGANREPSKAFRVQMSLGFPVLDSSFNAISPASLFSPNHDILSTSSLEVEHLDLLANNQMKLSLTNSNTEGNLNSSLEDGGCIECEAELVDIPLLSALDLGSEVVCQQYHSPGRKKENDDAKTSWKN